ncbi:hypothetical protein GCM10020255_105880 [Rhodococcus baikonurensis]
MTDNQKHASSNPNRSSNLTRNEGRASRTAFTVLIGVLALVLGACSVDHSGQDSSKETIRIAYQSFPSGDLIVKNNRWLEDALPEYNVKWTKFDSGADINTAFIAGEIDFGAIGSSPVARGLSAPLNIPYQVAFVLDVAGDNEALVARNATGIKTVADLRGKKVATAFASTAHYSLLAALNQAGLSADDVQLVDLQPQASLAAWQRGDIDAVYTWLPTLDELRKDGTQLIASRELATAENRHWIWVWCRRRLRRITPRSSTPGARFRPVRSRRSPLIRTRQRKLLPRNWAHPRKTRQRS